MMAYGAYYTASETLARPGTCGLLALPGCQGLSFFASRGLFAGGMASALFIGGETLARPGTYWAAALLVGT